MGGQYHEINIFFFPYNWGSPYVAGMPYSILYDGMAIGQSVFSFTDAYRFDVYEIYITNKTGEPFVLSQPV